MLGERTEKPWECFGEGPTSSDDDLETAVSPMILRRFFSVVLERWKVRVAATNDSWTATFISEPETET